MISIQRAHELISLAADPLVDKDCMGIETVALSNSMGRILREEICLDVDSPPFDRSIRDGFAIRSVDLETVPVELLIIGESKAGKSFEGVVGVNQCCEIMTGAVLPKGADAVVMVEQTKAVDGDMVRVLQKVSVEQNLQRVGEEAKAGDRVLALGQEIRPQDIGVLASVGRSKVGVSRKPRVAILSTGDELVEVGQQPRLGQVRDGNSHCLHAQCLEAGAEPWMLGVATDDIDDLTQKVSVGLEADILVTSGGVSMGKYDLVVRVFEELGTAIHFEKIAMKPGKPTVFGSRGQTFVFGLPGNPVSTVVSFQLFVRPLIRSLLHASSDETVLLEARLTESVACDRNREACVPAEVKFEGAEYLAKLVAWKGSSDLVGLSRANAYVMIPKQDGVLEAGATVRFTPIATK